MSRGAGAEQQSSGRQRRGKGGVSARPPPHLRLHPALLHQLHCAEAQRVERAPAGRLPQPCVRAQERAQVAGGHAGCLGAAAVQVGLQEGQEMGGGRGEVACPCRLGGDHACRQPLRGCLEQEGRWRVSACVTQGATGAGPQALPAGLLCVGSPSWLRPAASRPARQSLTTSWPAGWASCRSRP